MKQILIILLSIILSTNIFATKTTSIINGEWGHNTTWDNGVPSFFDTIVINTNVSINKNIKIGGTDSVYIIVYGVLTIECKNSNKGYKLSLPKGSAVWVNSGGEINGCSSSPAYIKIKNGDVLYSSANNNIVTGPEYLAAQRTTLPINLLFFKSYYDKNGIIISWKTATELNNHYFLILHSNSLKNWDTIMKVKGNGNSNIPIYYQILDEKLIPGDNYYKLLQIDYNGIVTEFNPIYQFIPNKINNMTFSVSPNPTEKLFMIKREFNGLAMLTIYDMYGKLLYCKPLNKKQMSVDVDMGDITAGKYIIVIRNVENIYTRILIIK